jgi:hypothetical protein
LLGEEALALQGLTKHHFPELLSFPNHLLKDLAGNAFNLPSYMIALLCLLASSDDLQG